MFERFDDAARRVIVYAQEEARLHDHHYIGTEHLLLGVLHDDQDVAAQVLADIGIELELVRATVDEIIGWGKATPAGQIPFTPPAKKVLELAYRESLALGHTTIGSGHLLLALAREGEGVACQVLQRHGASAAVIQHWFDERLGDAPDAPSPDPRTEIRRLVQAQQEMALGQPLGEVLAGEVSHSFRGARGVRMQPRVPSLGVDDFDDEVLQAVLAAREEARRLDRATVDLTCLLVGLASGSGPVAAAMTAAGADPATLRRLLDAALVLGRGSASDVPPLDASTAAALARARAAANGPASARAVLQQILAGVGEGASAVLGDARVDLAALRAAVST